MCLQKHFINQNPASASIFARASQEKKVYKIN